jgi:hypothetical protein
VIVPKGYKCTIKLIIKENCWYKELAVPISTKIVSADGKLLVKNISFKVGGAAANIPRVCPLSKIILRPHLSDEV